MPATAVFPHGVRLPATTPRSHRSAALAHSRRGGAQRGLTERVFHASIPATPKKRSNSAAVDAVPPWPEIQPNRRASELELLKPLASSGQACARLLPTQGLAVAGLTRQPASRSAEHRLKLQGRIGRQRCFAGYQLVDVLASEPRSDGQFALCSSPSPRAGRRLGSPGGESHVGLKTVRLVVIVGRLKNADLRNERPVDRRISPLWDLGHLRARR